MIFFIHFIPAVLLVFFLSGFLLNLMVLRNKKLHLYENIVFSFATSIVVIGFLALVSFLLHLNIKTATMSLISLTTIMFIVNICLISRGYINPKVHLFLSKVGDENITVYLSRFVMILLIILMLFNYEIEMPPLGQEDAVTLMPAQKILVLENLHYKQILFQDGDVSVYLIPLYSFMIALVSYISGLEVIQVYSHFRFILSLIAILNVFALCRAFFPKQRQLHWLSLIISISCLLNGWGGNFASGAWGQFMPFAQYQDLAICVMVPLALWCYYKGLLEGWYYVVIAFLLTAQLFFIHIREVLILLVLFCSVSLSLYFCLKDRLILLRGLLVVICLVLLGLVIRHIQSILISPYITMWNQDLKLATTEIIDGLVSKGSILSFLYPPIEDMPQLFSSFNLFYENPYYLIVLFLIPFMVSNKKEKELFSLGFINLSIAILTLIPIVSLYTVKFTYSQFLFGGPAYFGMFPLNFILFAYILFLVINFTNYYIKGHLALLVIITIPSVSLLLLIPQWVYRISPAILYLWLFCGSIFFFLSSKARDAISEKVRVLNDIKIDSRRCFIACLLILFVLSSAVFNNVMISMSPTFYKKPTSSSIAQQRLDILYQNQKKQVSVVNWSEWLKTNIKGISESSIKYIRENMDINVVFAVPVDKIYSFVNTTGRFVYTSGHYNSMVASEFFEKLYFTKYKVSLHTLMRDDTFRIEYMKKKEPRFLTEHKNIQYYLALGYITDDLMREEQPIFNKKDSPEMTLYLINEFNIQYIYTPPEWYEHLEDLSVKLKGKIEKIYDKDRYAIYKVRL